ncbi:MAG: amino acid permease [Planctomycetota bacterium]|jgi:amino acid transporter/mannitol/fructose-specific phosphotransferase system IIA component (Ntr-type)
MEGLKRQLGLMDVFSVSTGAMISSGLFILPAIAFSRAGPAVILSYFFAAILIIPSIFSQAELATAMPRAGGTYFYIERSLGSAWGLFSGFANWFSLTLKSAFAVVGMAILVEVVLQLFFEIQLSPWHIKTIAVVCCIGFTILNAVSVKQTSRFQSLLVIILLLILAFFVFSGLGVVKVTRLEGFLAKGWPAIFATSGLVFISFGGLTKVVSVAEEVKQPSKNLPLGMILSWIVVTFFYLCVVFVTVGVLDSNELSESLLPISTAANKTVGLVGFVFLSMAAIAAFLTTANGGILAASRSPMAMSRDKLLPTALARINKRFHTPQISIMITGGFMTTAIVLLDLEDLIKTASTLQLILFTLVNASVIIMRESKIQSYRPQFRSPLYPYIYIIAILAYIALIINMGKVPLFISGLFVTFSIAWYFVYVHRRVKRASAAMHVVERVTDRQLKTVTLENELRDILLERDEIIEDRFDLLIRHCEIIDFEEKIKAQQVFQNVSEILEKKLDISGYVLLEKFLQREKEGGTVIQPGFAIPHIIVEGQDKFEIVVVRASHGIEFPEVSELVKIMFVLAGSKDERNYHLRALMAIARIAQEKDFEKRWFTAKGIEGIRNLILLSARKRDTGPDQQA